MRIKVIVLFIFIATNIGFTLKVGLDSGHSIKELYKSGGSFDVKKRNSQTGNIETKSYYSVAWPEGGVRLENTKEKHKGQLSSAYSATKRNVYGTYVKMNNAVDLEKWDKKTSAVNYGGQYLFWQDVRVMHRSVKKVNLASTKNIWVYFPNYKSDNPYWKDKILKVLPRKSGKGDF